MVIGNKDRFAIEVFPVDGMSNEFRHIRLWIVGNSLGSMEESQMIGIFLGELERVINSRENNIEISLSEKPALELLEFFNSDGKYLMSFGESFDDFHVCSAQCEGNIIFAWQLHEAPFFEYENPIYKPLKGIVPIAEVQAAIREVERCR